MVNNRSWMWFNPNKSWTPSQCCIIVRHSWRSGTTLCNIQTNL